MTPSNPQSRIAFLGASGHIGTLLQRASALSPPAQVDFHWQFRSAQHLPQTGFTWADFTSADPLLSAQDAVGGFDAMMIFSGVTRQDRKSDAEAMRLNVDLVVQALMAAARAGIKRVFVASSSAVYGAGRGKAFAETSPLNPINAYGDAKVAMEEMAVKIAQAQGIDLCLLRIGNVAGADMLLKNAQTGRPLTLDVFPDGEGPRRSYIGPRNLLEVLSQLALNASIEPVVNIGAAKPVAMNTLLQEAGYDWSQNPCSDASHQDIHLNTEKLQTLLPAGLVATDASSIIKDWQAVRELP